MANELKDIVKTINMLARRVRTLEANSYSPGITKYTKLVSTPTTLRVFEYGNYWMAEVMITGFDINGGVSPPYDTTIETGINVADYGTTVRGGYSAHGQIIGDSSISNQYNAIFECSARFITTASREYGSYIFALDGTIYNDVAMTITAGGDIQLKFTSTYSTDFGNCTLHMFMLKQPL